MTPRWAIPHEMVVTLTWSPGSITLERSQSEAWEGGPSSCSSQAKCLSAPLSVSPPPFPSLSLGYSTGWMSATYLVHGLEKYYRSDWLPSDNPSEDTGWTRIGELKIYQLARRPRWKYCYPVSPDWRRSYLGWTSIAINTFLPGAPCLPLGLY